MNHYTKYLGRRSFNSTVTQTDTYIGPTALPGPPTRSVKGLLFSKECNSQQHLRYSYCDFFSFTVFLILFISAVVIVSDRVAWSVCLL